MGCCTLELELIDEVILSQRSASLGGHRSLDRIPGATLLGAASALYHRLERRDAWDVFHSGKVRFGDGLPLADGAPGWPVPLCWHQAKGGESVTAGRYQAERVHNLIHTDGQLAGAEAGLQPRQLREAYVTARGVCLRPAMEFRMRTAIDPSQGRAAAAQLFGFEGLRAGQRFLAPLEWDDEVSPGAVDALRAFFSNSGTLRLGRSRAAQFGRVKCQLREDAAGLPLSGAPDGARLTLWLLSDLAACRQDGAPTLTPAPDDLGLPPGRLLPERTYARFRAYAPYNGFQKLYDRERQVIAAGSVLTYELERTPTPEDWHAIRHTVARGLGLYRECGLGRAVLEPVLLAGVHPEFTPDDTPVAGENDLAREDGAVGALLTDPVARSYASWLARLASGQEAEAERKQWAEQCAAALAGLERNARALHGLGEQVPAGPGKAQWGRVADAAKSAAQQDDSRACLYAALFDAANGICKQAATQQDWGMTTQWTADDGADRTGAFAAWLRERCDERATDVPIAIGLLANLAQKRLNTRQGG